MAMRGRPKGTGKPPGEKYVLKAFKVPPDLWEAFSKAVPRSQWSETIRGYMEREIRRQGKKPSPRARNATGAAGEDHAS